MASRAESPTETESRGQQRVVAEGPIGSEEALRPEGERFRIGDGIVKHAPSEINKGQHAI